MRKKIFVALGMVAIPLLAFSIAQRTYQWVQPQGASAQVTAPPVGELPDSIVLPPFVIPHPWTAVGASGTVDELSLPFFQFTGASAGYRFGAPTTNPLEFRYNVTNTYDNAANPNIPGWTRLELGASAPGNSNVNATLYRVNRCNGARTFICGTRVAQSTTGVCNTCTFASTAVNFASYLYYVDVSVDRAVVAEAPYVHTLRIY